MIPERDMLSRLTSIFQDVLNPAVVVTENLDASQVPEWDSLSHISLIVAIEAEFEVEFTTDELVQMTTVGDLMRTLRAKGV